ncbi:MAG: phosphate ABC transporter permease subunit PstC [Odoribacteraceae bacterium]|jgi:phosphate transport system permease protein|nr:phosphate ABC transporter permease subunit PstC [Odoribacteraceae bacterium]
MKWSRRFVERIIEGLFTLSGGVTSLIILLVVLFLFREGAGLFTSPSLEKGYTLCVHASNLTGEIDAREVKRIFDGEITRWEEVGAGEMTGEIDVFHASELPRVEDEAVMPRVLEEIVGGRRGIIAFLPDEFLPAGESVVKRLAAGRVTPGDFFAGDEWQPTVSPAPRLGVLPLVTGTLLVSFFAIILALVPGLGVAIYLAELAGSRARGWLKPAIELLAGIPSVVYGFFGLVVLVPFIQEVFDLPVGESALAGSVVLAIMALPTIITIAEDAIRGVPRALREASLALGATRWQTIYRVVIPRASSGITAAAVLGIGRAVGETMAVLMVTGNAAVMPRSLFEPVRTIPATIAAELGEAPSGGTHYRALFLLGCILFAITMVINLSAEFIATRGQGKGEGA